MRQLLVLLLRIVNPLLGLKMEWRGLNRASPARLRLDEKSGEVLIPALNQNGDLEWRTARNWAGEYINDPGSLASCIGWTVGGETEKVIYQKNGIRFSETAALDALGGTWRCLRTSENFGVIQSAIRVLHGNIHAGALVGYTRIIAAAALLVCSESKKPRVLNLGLGAGSVPNFLCAHLRNASVLAIELSDAVVQATRHIVTPEPGYVDIVLDDAINFSTNYAKEYQFDLVVIDLFDMQSKPPSSLASPVFAQNIASFVHDKAGGVVMNLITITALGSAHSAGTICADAAYQFVQTFTDQGKRAFLTLDPDTENAVLWCLPLPRFLPSPLAVKYLTTFLAPARASKLGVQFDVRAQLAPTIEVTADTVRAALSASSSFSRSSKMPSQY
mmetsp:Transcript_19226/g.29154  ORF Transcript_19226/g.29154 Transcript_19226/m.29154 type:complete len:388 (-) Transcript_19226:48-1211(-)